MNRYSYVVNNPLVYVDPSGNCWGPARNVPGCQKVREALGTVEDLVVDTAKSGVEYQGENQRVIVEAQADAGSAASQGTVPIYFMRGVK